MAQFSWKGTSLATNMNDHLNWGLTDGQPPGTPGANDLAYVGIAATLVGHLTVNIFTLDANILLGDADVDANFINIRAEDIHFGSDADVVVRQDFTIRGELSVDGDINGTGTSRLIVAGLGGPQGDAARLTLNNGSNAAFGGATIGGGGVGGTGIVTVNAGAGLGINGAAAISIGSHDFGGLNIVGGFAAVTPTQMLIGSSSTNGIGELKVSGANGVLQALNATLTVGGGVGDGRVEVSNDAGVNAFNLVTGAGSDPRSSVVVTGAGSFIQLGGFLTVGEGSPAASFEDTETPSAIGGAGNALLTVNNEMRIEAGGGVRVPGGVTIGNLADASGRMIIDGQSSGLDVSSFLTVGNAGHGELITRNGGGFFTPAPISVNIGQQAGSFGAVEIRNTNYGLRASEFDVGDQGEGSLLVADGGNLNTNGTIRVGNVEGADGSVTVTGENSEIRFASGFVVGRGGDGTLTIEEGAEVSLLGGGAGLTIAELASARGEVTVYDGTFNAGGQNIVVGDAGIGELNVEFHSLVTLGNLVIAAQLRNPASPFSTVNVSSGFAIKTLEPDQGLIAADDITVGDGGRGALNLTAEGYVEADNVTVGDQAGSNGTISIEASIGGAPGTPAKAELNVVNTLTVGNLGFGELEVGHGDSFVIADTIIIGAEDRGSPDDVFDGVASVEGTMQAALVVVGQNGHGKLTVGAAGDLRTNTLSIGTGANSNGEVYLLRPFATLTGVAGGPPNINIGQNGGEGLLVYEDMDLEVAQLTIGQNGTLRGWGTLNSTAGFDNDGEVRADSTGFFLRIVGDVTGDGTLIIEENAHLRLSGDSDNDVDFEGGRGTRLTVDFRDGMPDVEGLRAGSRINLQGLPPQEENYEPEAGGDVDVDGVDFNVTADNSAPIGQYHFKADEYREGTGGTYLVWVRDVDWNNAPPPGAQSLAAAALPAEQVDFNNLTANQQAIVAAGAEMYFWFGGDDVIALPNLANMAAIGWDSNNQVDAGSGDDTIFGGDGNDNIAGGIGNDVLHGGLGADALEGGGDGDLLVGGGGDDSLAGGTEGDFMDGGTGGDALDGGAGFDLASWLSQTNGLTLNLGNQGLNAGAAAGDTVTNVEALYLTNSADSFTAGAAGLFVYGFGGNDTLIGSSQSDFFDGGAGGDAINAGDGFDYVSYNSSTAAVTLNLQTPASNTGHAAGDAISNADAYILTEFGDTFIGLISGQNIVLGYGGNDTLTGGFNANNWFFGGDGNDRMVGGGVADLFVGDSGADTIVPVTRTPIAGSSVFGFTPGTDAIEISRSAFGLSAGYAVTAGTTFAAGTSPVNTVASPTFLYYTNLGLLYFDPDGTGATAATLLMQFAGAPALVASDFHLV